MSANERSDGLLRALQDLPEADRDRIVKHLPPEEVQNVFSLLLRKQDRVSLPQPQPPVHATSSAPQMAPADEPVAAPKRRRSSAASFDDSKRARTDAAEEQEIVTAAAHLEVKKEQVPANAEVAGQQENGNSTARLPVKKEQKIIDLISDDEEPEHEVNHQQNVGDRWTRTCIRRLPKPRAARESNDLSKQRKPQAHREPRDLPMYLRVCNERGQHVLKDFDDLPVLVQAELKRRYEEMHSSTKDRRDYYAGCSLKPENYTDDPDKQFCIRNTIVRGSGKTRQVFSQGGHFKATADDRCINAGSPCAHFHRHELNRDYIIRLVPLPSTLRQGKNWRDLGYWVL
ncbi:uncharacterized protein J4E78_002651 [Alternaria triticimaculans]|uniref:uncharacterized protein n=1 Tax=Alternaria triticimaculans TaxID=297637 RepID=UPI0020C4EAD3|nr:uncharacterized protein J4E78_002651 [Alternaria triticimaculans]KAI4668823.1 hypothetical protein J4E78_002651 [Alternaria triticimaculans]